MCVCVGGHNNFRGQDRFSRDTCGLDEGKWSPSWLASGREEVWEWTEDSWGLGTRLEGGQKQPVASTKC